MYQLALQRKADTPLLMVGIMRTTYGTFQTQLEALKVAAEKFENNPTVRIIKVKK